MPQVPYDGVQRVAPNLEPTPRFQVAATPDAFGVNVAQAVEGLGKAVDGAGTEIYQRGIAMQDLYNHSEAQAAAAKFMEAAGDVHAKLGAMQGKDAVDYYAKGFKTDLENARQDIRSGLSNPMAQKLFDSESLSTVGRTMFNGAGVAANANKQYAISSNEAQTSHAVAIAATSNNPADVEAARKHIKILAKDHAALKGQDDDSAEEYARKINSSLDANNIQYVARTDPDKAAAMLEAKRDGMNPADFDRTRIVVDNQNRAVNSVVIAQDVITKHVGPDGKSDVTFEQLQKEAEEKAQAKSNGDAVMVKHTVDTLKGLYNQKVYADKQQRYDNLQTVDGRIQEGVRDAADLRQDPKAAAAMDALPKSDQLRVPGKINAYNAARDKADNEQSMTRLLGMRNNDVERFLNTDPTDPDLKLSQPQIRQVMKWQQEDKQNPNGDPRVNRALGWLRGARGGELAALGVFHRDAKNPDDYDHMTGTLQSALDLWQQSHGKAAEYKDVIDTIGPQVIRSRAVPGWLFGDKWQSNEPFYKPDENSQEYKNFATKATQDVVAAGQPEPSKAEIDRAYTRMQLLKLYPPKATSAAKPNG